MNIQIAIGILSFMGFYLTHMLVSKKADLREARGHLKGQLNQRYALIPLMLEIMQVHTPLYGEMFEELIKMRLGSAKGTDVEEEIQQEIFQSLFDLVQLSGYNTINDKVQRDEFNSRFNKIEANIQAAQNYYLSALKGYNRLGKLCKMERVEAYNYPKIQFSTVENKESIRVKLVESLSVG